MILENEKILFIKLLHDYVNNKRTSIDGSYDWDELYKIAKHHQLVPIIYHQIKNKNIPNSNFRRDYYFQISQYTQRNKLNVEIESNISAYDYAFMKGKVIGDLYPNPELRTMVDSDILIHEKDLGAIQRILMSKGFEGTGDYSGVWTCSKNGLTFEIHQSLIENRREKKLFVKYFAKVWEHYADHKIDWDFHFIYIMMHLRDHFIGHGVGFRQFMDIAIITQKVELNWNWIEEELRKINLLKFAKIVFFLNESWFGVKAPIAVDDMGEGFLNRATELIMESGTFGIVDENSPGYWIVKYSTERDISFKEAKIKLLISILFPPYDRMVILPYCSYLKKYKFLLPIAWLHRIILRIPNKSSRKDVAYRVSQPEDSSLERLKLMEEWGLKESR